MKFSLRQSHELKMVQKKIVIALPERFGKGLKQRALLYGEDWKKIGEAFPELEIWLIKFNEPNHRMTGLLNVR